MRGDDLVGRCLGPRDSGDKILRLIVDQADHGPHAVKAPEHELGVGVEGAVIEDRPVDAMALDGIRAAIEGSKESRRQKSVLSVLAVRRVGQFGKFWPGGFCFGGVATFSVPDPAVTGSYRRFHIGLCFPLLQKH